MKVALTFDDGPNGEYTLEILKILQNHAIKACFFFLGKNVERQPDIALKAKDQGHLIASHTYDHQHLANLTKGQILWQIEETEQIFKALLGITPKFIRMPYGESNEIVEKIIKDKGYTLIGWDPRVEDHKKGSPQEIVDDVMEKICHIVQYQRCKQHGDCTLTGRLRTLNELTNCVGGTVPEKPYNSVTPVRKQKCDGIILTLHDGANVRIGESRINTVKALPDIIRELKERGFEFVRLDRL